MRLPAAVVAVITVSCLPGRPIGAQEAGGFEEGGFEALGARPLLNLPASGDGASSAGAGSVREVAVDLAAPYRVHVALDGFGAWRVPSTSWVEPDPTPGEWLRSAPGAAVGVLPDSGPGDGGFVAMADGTLRRWDPEPLRWRDVSPWAPPGSNLRFAGIPPLERDPFRGELLYYGSQFVHRTSTGGESWQVISNALSEEGGITSLRASPVQEELIWAATTDGRLHLTRSSGGTWTELTSSLPEAVRDPGAQFRIVPSVHHGGTAFLLPVAGDAASAGAPLYRTTDYGARWEALAADQGVPVPVVDLQQDPLHPQLLFVATPEGVYLSMDGGQGWTSFPGNLPGAEVRSVVVHPRDYDLVVGFADRGVWIVDDIRPLREMAWNRAAVESGLHLSPPPPAYLPEADGRGSLPGVEPPPIVGESRARGALISFFDVDARPGDSVDIAVVDGRNRTLHRRRVGVTPGLNRVAWNLEELPMGLGGSVGGLPPLRVLPGSYTVRVTDDGGAVREETLQVLPDPRVEIDMGVRTARHDALQRTLILAAVPVRAVPLLESAVDALDGARAQVRGAAAPDPGGDALLIRIEALLERARSLLGQARGQDPLSMEGGGSVDPLRIAEALATTSGALTETQRIALFDLEEAVLRFRERANTLLLGDLGLLGDALRARGADPPPDFESLAAPVLP